MSSNNPYLYIRQVTYHKVYNPDFGDNKLCECGHTYYRHFDPYEDMEPVGCKYCGCYEFKLAKDQNNKDQK